jgi:hypothetical protein
MPLDYDAGVYSVLGQPVANGDEIDLVLDDGCFVRGRFEERLTYPAGRPKIVAPRRHPELVLAVAARGRSVEVRLAIPKSAELRWPPRRARSAG